MNEEQQEAVMIRYLLGTCSPEEKNLFETWLQASKENRQQYYETKLLWHASRIEHFEEEGQLNQALDRFNSTIQHRQELRKRKIYRHTMRYAALLIGALAISWIFLTWNDNKKTTRPFITAAVSQTDTSKLVVLEDGTRVWLNNNSRIIYPQQFFSKERAITLEGEAYFDVTHDPARPFIVQTPTLRIKVLGTTFNVNAYKENEQTETVLLTGKIALSDSAGNELAVIKPGQLAIYDKNNHHLAVKDVLPDRYASWRHGQITLTNANLEIITRKLFELYQVRCSIDPSVIDTIGYNFTFSKTKPVEKILEMLSFIAPIQYKNQGNGILITNK